MKLGTNGGLVDENTETTKNSTTLGFMGSVYTLNDDGSISAVVSALKSQTGIALMESQWVVGAAGVALGWLLRDWSLPTPSPPPCHCKCECIQGASGLLIGFFIVGLLILGAAWGWYHRGSYFTD